jgi:hypothetical protein
LASGGGKGVSDYFVTSLWSIPVFSFITAGAGAYLGGYLKKRGENLATKDDFNDLKAQTAALTLTTKEIESKIDDQVWNRQRQWELKKQGLLEGAAAINEFMAAVMKVNGAYLVDESKEDITFRTQLTNHRTDAMTNLNKASYEFQRAQVLLSVVSGLETQRVFISMAEILKDVASKIIAGNATIFKEREPLIRANAGAITNAIRRELGIEGLEPMSQSIESLEAQAPGPSDSVSKIGQPVA